jgi:hypothetical protein
MAVSVTPIRDTKWLTLEVCREFQRGTCSRPDTECKFAHPSKSCQVENGRVIACFDSLKVSKYYIILRIRNNWIKGIWTCSPLSLELWIALLTVIQCLLTDDVGVGDFIEKQQSQVWPNFVMITFICPLMLWFFFFFPRAESVSILLLSTG